MTNSTTQPASSERYVMNVKNHTGGLKKMSELSSFELAVIIILAAVVFVFVLPRFKWGMWNKWES